MSELDDILAAQAAAKTGTAAPASASLDLDTILKQQEAAKPAVAARSDLDQPAVKPGLLDRAGATLSGIGHTIAGGAKAVGESIAHPIDTITNPARRRQFERGLDDMVTLGYGQKLAARVGNALGDAPERALGPETFGGGPVANTQAADQAAAPEFRQLGNLAGTFTPGATTAAAGLGGRVVGTAGRVLGAPATAAGRAALSTGKALAGYEATAVPLAAASAGAEGHRLEAAEEAATNPVGLGLSTVAGLSGAKSEGLDPAIQRRLGLAKPTLRERVVEGAQERATKDIARDIVSAEGPKAKATDQARIKETSDRLFKLTQQYPELRQVWRESARKALPQIEEAKSVAARPLDGKYEAVDKLTGGGIRLGDILDGFENAAKESAKTASGQPQAARIRAVRDNFVKAYGEPGFDPTVDVGGVPAGEVVKRLAKTPGAEEQIAEVKRIAESGVDLDKRIPTALFRKEVTDLHKTAEAAMGTIEGTAKHEALGHLYDVGKSIIDKHLNESGLPAEDLAALRKANDEYFLLTRAENAIKSRGIKEENRPTGLAHSAHQAIKNGSAAELAAYSAMHPHAIPTIAAAYGIGHALPALRSRIDWRLANMNRTGRALPSLPALSPSIAPRIIRASSPENDGANIAQALAPYGQTP